MILGDPMEWTWTSDGAAAPSTGQTSALRYRHGFRLGWVHVLLLMLGG